MNQCKKNDLAMTEQNVIEFGESHMSALDLIAREGARKMLQVALEPEVDDYISQFTELLDENGRRLVVRNGHHKARKIATGAGQLEIKAPRIADHRKGHRFTSAILPPYMRKSPTLEALIPCLYLKGISTGQFKDALEAILGPNAYGLSASTINGMMKGWEQEFEQWNNRSLEGKEYVYLWADGIYLNVRLGDSDKVCMLVIMGTTKDGRKELVGLQGGYRESKTSWRDLLQSLKKRGLKENPKLAVADGALGFWAALAEEYPKTLHQRCWVHKTANILDKMPKKVQERAKDKIHEIYLAETKDEALEAYDKFLSDYRVKYPKACECLTKDKEELFAFFDFPAEHWVHIRTSNPIESTFATVRHRTKRTKGHGTRTAAEAMTWKLCLEAEKRWRRINGYELIIKIYEGVEFKDGLEVKAA